MLPALGRRIQHLRAIVAPIPNCWVGWRHLHAIGIVGVEKVEGRSRITILVVNAEPAIIVPGVQDKGKTIMNLGDKLIRLLVTRAKVSSRVPSGRFHESQMPAKAKGPGALVMD